MSGIESGAGTHSPSIKKGDDAKTQEKPSARTGFPCTSGEKLGTWPQPQGERKTPHQTRKEGLAAAPLRAIGEKTPECM